MSPCTAAARYAFETAMQRDRDDLIARIRLALADNGGVVGAAEAFGLRPTYFRQKLAVLGIEVSNKEPRHYPTRIQLWNALVYYRGNHRKVADHFGVTRDWVVRAMDDYKLRAVAPPAYHPYWRAYDHVG